LTNTDTGLTIAGRPMAAGALPTVQISVATASYFRAMGIAVEEGRTFGPLDTNRSTPVTVINESMARRFYLILAM
jgi:hypothetical protein